MMPWLISRMVEITLTLFIKATARRGYDREPVEALLRGAVRRRCDFYWPESKARDSMTLDDLITTAHNQDIDAQRVIR